MSYNVLAPLYVRTIDLRTGEPQPFAAFEWAEPADQVLDWDVRKPRLIAELNSCGADVICLQEVQFEKHDAGEFRLPDWLTIDGYVAELPSQKSLSTIAERNLRVLAKEVAIGNAILFRNDRIAKVEVAELSSENTRVALCCRGHGILAPTLGRMVVYSVHLDATGEDKRVKTLIQCMKDARSCSTREVVIAGDMNTECLPGSCVGAFLAGSPEPSADELISQCASALRICGGPDEEEAVADVVASGAAPEPTKEQLEVWKALRKSALDATLEQRIQLSHVWTGPTRAAWDHGATSGPCVAWRLDHIFFTARSLRLRSSWAALEADPESLAVGLPNLQCPSDHLPVAASFQPSLPPALSEPDRVAILEKLQALEKSHSEQRSSLEQDLMSIRPTDEAAVVETVVKGKTRKMDSPEMIAFKREERRRKKELAAAQLSERERFVVSLCELELDHFEESCSSTEWIASGLRRSR